MDMSLVSNVLGSQQANLAAQVGVAVQKKSMDAVEMQGQAIIEMMQSMGIGQNLDIEA